MEELSTDLVLRGHRDVGCRADSRPTVYRKTNGLGREERETDAAALGGGRTEPWAGQRHFTLAVSYSHLVGNGLVSHKLTN